MNVSILKSFIWCARVGVLLGLLGMLAAIFILPVCAASSGGGFILSGESVEANVSSGSTGAGFTLSANTSPITGSFAQTVTGPSVITSSSGGGGVVFPSSSKTTPSANATGAPTAPSTSSPSTPATSSPSQEKSIYNVQILFLTETSAVITFDSSLAAISAVTYKSGTLAGSSGMSQEFNFTHEKTLQGLSPDSSYTFSIYLAWSDQTSTEFTNDTYTFTTLASPSVPKSPKPTSQNPKTQTSTQDRTLSETPPIIEEPISPPTNLTAIPLDPRTIHLTWQNPIQNNFKQIVIVRSDVNFPQSPKDGTVVYQGSDHTFTDTQADTSKPYFYTIFAADTKGAYSIGAPVKSNPLQKQQQLPSYNQATATEQATESPKPEVTDQMLSCTTRIPWPIFFISLILLILSALAWWRLVHKLKENTFPPINNQNQ